MRIRKFTATAMMAGLSLATAGCSAGSNPSNAAITKDSPESGPYTVIYAEGAKTVSDWDHYVAEAFGYYEKYDVVLKGVSTQTATAATQLLVTGEANVGRGLPPTVQVVGQSNGAISLIDIADLLIRPPFVLNARTAVTWDEMAGKKLGVSSPTDSTAVVAKEALAKQGVDAVKLVSSGGTGTRLAALLGGAIDAALLLPPANFTAEDEGLTRVGYLPEDLGDDWQFAFTSIIVEPKWAEANKEAVVGLLSARHEALQWLADPANEAEAIEILAKATDVSTEIAGKTYELLGIGTDQSAFAAEIGIQEKAADGVLTALQSMGQANKSMKLADITDDSYAAEVRKAMAK